MRTWRKIAFHTIICEHVSLVGSRSHLSTIVFFKNVATQRLFSRDYRIDFYSISVQNIRYFEDRYTSLSLSSPLAVSET